MAVSLKLGARNLSLDAPLRRPSQANAVLASPSPRWRSLHSGLFAKTSPWNEELRLSLDASGGRRRFPSRRRGAKIGVFAVLQPLSFQGNVIPDHDNNRQIKRHWLNYQPRKSNSAWVSFLVDYSVFMSDCWRIQGTAKDRVEKGLSHAMPVVRGMGSLATPVAQTVGQVAHPVARTVNNIAIPVVHTVSGVANPVVKTVSQIALPVAETVGQITNPLTQSIMQLKFWPLDIITGRMNKENKDNAVSESEEETNVIVSEKAAEVLDETQERQESGEEIVSETVDDLDPSVIWGQRAKDVEAEKERGVMSSPGFSFSAAGLLFPYHLGVAQLLIEKGLIKENTPLAGASAGAIVCAVIASGVSMKEALEATKQLAKDCRENGTVYRLGAVLRKFLEDFLPEDAHITSSGRIRVAVTQLFRNPRSLLVDQFDSKDDLINALITSSYVPGFLAPVPVTRFRNVLCVDGGLSSFIPPTAADSTVRICAFPASSLGFSDEGISPDQNPENRASMRQLFSWALEPAEDFILDIMFEDGYNDAMTWLLKTQNNYDNGESITEESVKQTEDVLTKV